MKEKNQKNETFNFDENSSIEDVFSKNGYDFNEINKIISLTKSKDFNLKKIFKEIEAIILKINKYNFVYNIDKLICEMTIISSKFKNYLKDKQKNINTISIYLFFQVHLSFLKNLEIKIRKCNFYDKKNITEGNLNDIKKYMEEFIEKNMEFFHILNGIITEMIDVNDVMKKIDEISGFAENNSIEKNENSNIVENIIEKTEDDLI